jgi:hypothetical protein
MIAGPGRGALPLSGPSELRIGRLVRIVAFNDLGR